MKMLVEVFTKKLLKNHNIMSQSSFIKVGSILSEFQTYKVLSVDTRQKNIQVEDTAKNVIELPFNYVDSILKSADYVERVEKKTVTELSDIVLNNPRIAMSVAFTKKGKELSNKAYKQKIDSAVQKFENAKVSEIATLVTELINNPITKTEPGEFRVMKGVSLGTLNSLGRIEFMDMEDKLSVPKQVDPRTIEYVILDKVKYELK